MVIVGGGVESILRRTRHVGHFWPIVPAPGHCEDGEFGERRLAGETEVLGENLPQHHFVHHKSHLIRPVRTRAAAVGNQRLTASAMARPLLTYYAMNLWRRTVSGV
jgi:hypothetical protein